MLWRASYSGAGRTAVFLLTRYATSLSLVRLLQQLIAAYPTIRLCCSPLLEAMPPLTSLLCSMQLISIMARQL